MLVVEHGLAIKRFFSFSFDVKSPEDLYNILRKTNSSLHKSSSLYKSSDLHKSSSLYKTISLHESSSLLKS